MPSASTVDERIVEAKFDSSDFEKGVNRTVKKLDELKKSLNLKDSSKSIAEISEQTKNATESMSQSVDKLTDRFTNFAGMIKQKLLSGLADQVVGVFFKIESGILSLTKQLSSQQIGVGLQKYYDMLTSVRTTVASRSGENAISEDSAYGAIEKIGAYADETSYSLNQMSDAMSKMVAAGSSLDSATASVQGIANACAIAGVNASDAQRAFFNLSQAYSSGYLKYTDYRSLQLLNMTNEQFEEALLAAAEAEGTLKKIKDGVYKTQKSATNKKVTAGKTVTRKNLSDALRYNFADTAVLDRLFGSQKGGYAIDIDRYNELAYDKEGNRIRTWEQIVPILTEEFGELATKAFAAAREARSFTDVINYLKDVVSRGWSTTFEHLFGKLEESVAFFTNLSEGRIADAIRKIGEWRNSVLEVWNQSNGSGHTGRELFLDSLLEIDGIIGDILLKIESFLPDSEFFGSRLIGFTEDLNTNLHRIHDWLSSEQLDNGETRLDRLGNIISIFGNIFSTAMYAAGKAIELVTPLFMAGEKVLDALLSPVSEFGKESDVFQILKDSIDNLYIVLSPIVDVLSNLIPYLGELAAFFLSMSIETMVENIRFVSDAFGLLLEALGIESAQKKDGRGVIDGIKESIDGLKKSCTDALSAVKEFFGALLSDLKLLLGLTEEQQNGSVEGGLFQNIKNFFDTNQFLKDADAWIQQAQVDVRNWIANLPQTVTNFANQIFDAIWGLFYTKKTVTYGPNETISSQTYIGETDLKRTLDGWFDTVKNAITEFLESIPQRIRDFFNNIPTVWQQISDVFFEIFYGTEDSTASEQGAAQTTNIPQTLDEWLVNVRNQILEFIRSIPQRLSDLGTQIYEAIWGLFNVRKTAAYSPNAELSTVTYVERTPFGKWLDNIVFSIKKWLKNLPKISIQDIIHRMFFDISEDEETGGTIVTDNPFTVFLKSIFGDKQIADAQAVMLNFASKIDSIFSNLKTTLKSIWNSITDSADDKTVIDRIKEIFGSIYNYIISIFSGSIDADFNSNWLGEKVASAIQWIKTKAEETWPAVKSFIESIPSKIVALFSGEDDSESGPIGTALKGFGNSIGKAIEDLGTEILPTFFTNAIAEIEKLWTNLYDSLTGKDSSVEAASGIDADSEKSKWDTFIENWGTAISEAFAKLPTFIAQGVEIALSGIQWAIDSITNWFNGEGKAGAIAEAISGGESIGETIASAVSDQTSEDHPENQPALIKAITGIGQKIAELIFTTIPTFIKSGFDWIATQATDWWLSLSGIFDGWLNGGDDSESKKPLVEKIKEVGTTIKEWIKSYTPNFIIDGYHSVKDKWHEWSESLNGIFEGWIENAESSPLKAKIGEIGLKIKEWIENLPEYIKSGFETLKKFFSGESGGQPFSLPKGGMVKKPLSEQVSDLLSEQLGDTDSMPKGPVNKDLDKIVNNLIPQENQNNMFDGIKDFFKRIGEKIQEAFGIVIPYIINGWNDTIKKIGEFLGYIGDIITGKLKIEDVLGDVFGKENAGAIVSAFDSFKTTISEFFISTLPKFIGEISSKIAENAPSWFSGIFGSLTSAFTSNAEGAEKAVETYSKVSEKAGTGSGASKSFEKEGIFSSDGLIMKIFNFFSETAKTVSDSPLLKVGLVISLIVMALSKLSDLFGIADEIEAATGAVKWTAIGIAIAGITGIMGYITYLSSLDDGQAKMQRVYTALNNIANFIERIGVVLVIIKGLSLAGGVVDTMKTFYETGGKEAKGNRFLSTLSGFAGSILGGIGVGLGSQVAVNGISAALDGLVDTFLDLGLIIDTFVTNLEPALDNMSSLSSKLELSRSSLEQVGELLTDFKELLGLTRETTLTIGSEGRAEADDFYNSLEKDEDGTLKSLAFLSSNKKEFLELFIAIGSFFSDISVAIDRISTIENPEEQISKLADLFDPDTSEEFGRLIENFTSGMTTWFTVNNWSMGDTEQTAKSINAFGLAIGTFVESMNAISPEKMTSFNSVLETFNKMVDATTKIESKTSIFDIFDSGVDSNFARAGRAMQSFGGYMKRFFQYVNDITEIRGSDEATIKKYDGTVNAMMLVLSSFADSFAVMKNGEMSIMNSAMESLPGIGTKLGEFVSNMNGAMPETIDLNRVKSMAELLSSLGSVAVGMSALDTSFSNYYNEDAMNYVNRYSQLLDALLQNKDSLISVGKEMAGPLAQGIQEAFDNPDDSNIKIRVRPVLEMDAISEQLSGQTFDANGNFTGLRVDIPQELYDRIDIPDYTQRLVSIEDKIGRLSSDIGSLGSSIGSMRLYLNGQALVGGIIGPIREILADDSFRYYRGITAMPK